MEKAGGTIPEETSVNKLQLRIKEAFFIEAERWRVCTYADRMMTDVFEALAVIGDPVTEEDQVVCQVVTALEIQFCTKNSKETERKGSCR